MKKFTVQSIMLLTVITVAVVFFTPVGNTPKSDIPFLPQPPQIQTLTINGNKLEVEIADTDSKRNKGLGNRDTMASDSGMLFVYTKQDKYAFWMKGMKFSLDFVWIRGNTVVDVLLNVPQPLSGQKDADLPEYASKELVDKVLEVNSGVVQKLNIKSGDTIELK